MTEPTPKQLHQFILDSFSEVEIDLFCLEYFPDVLPKFGSGMSVTRKVFILLDYCQRRLLTDRLLVALEEERGETYRQTFGS